MTGTTYPAAPEWQRLQPMSGWPRSGANEGRDGGAGRTAVAAAGGGGGGEVGRRRPGSAWPGLACPGAGVGSGTMSLQYGAEEAPLAGSYGAADSFPKDFGYGVEEEEEEAAVAGGGVGAGAGGGCGPGGADSSKPRILLMGLRRSGKSSIQKVSGAAPRPPARPRGRGWPPRGRGPRERAAAGAGRGAAPPHLASEQRSPRGPRPVRPRPSLLRPSGSPRAKLAGRRQVPVAPPGTAAPREPAPVPSPTLTSSPVPLRELRGLPPLPGRV